MLFCLEYFCRIADTLHASGLFTEPVSVELKLINPSKKRLSFKIKTTAPKAYTVRPNSGIVGSNDKTAVIGKSYWNNSDLHLQLVVVTAVDFIVAFNRHRQSL